MSKGAVKIVVACGLAVWTPLPAFAQLQITVYPAPPQAVIDDQSQAQNNIDSTPGNASLTDDREWSDQRADTVKDITDYIPGITDQPHNGAESNRLSIRGSGLADIFQGRGLLVMQDGIPINMADGEFEFPMIDPWLTRYVEVFPGANGLEYGSSTLGGAINFVTPNGTTDSGYDVRGEGGSFGTVHGQLTWGQAWDGYDLFAAVDGFSQDGFRQQNEQQTGRLAVNWGWQPTEHFANRIYINHIVSDAEIPGALSLAQIAVDPSQANLLNSAGNYQRNLDITRIADKSVWEEGVDRVETSFFYTYRSLDNPVTTYEFQHNNDFGMRVKYTHSYGPNQWFVGMNNYYGDADESRYQNNGGVPGAHILDRNLYASTSEIYGQVEQQLVEKLYGILGAQGSYAMRDITQSFPTVGVQDADYAGFNPRAGLRYDVDAETQLFTNLSRSFEPPSWNELSGGNSPGFKQLKAQTGTTVEIGARGDVEQMHWDAAYYHGWFRNEFVNYLFPNGDTATINAAKTSKDGIELGLNGDAMKNVWLQKDAIAVRAAYTYSHFTLDDDTVYGNKMLPGVPEHYLRAELLYRHPSGVSFGPNVEWAPENSPVDLANTLYAPGYAIYGARVFWESEDRRLNFYVEGRNLFNRTYIATYNVIPDASGNDSRSFYPGEGRAVYAGFRIKF